MGVAFHRDMDIPHVPDIAPILAAIAIYVAALSVIGWRADRSAAGPGRPRGGAGHVRGPRGDRNKSFTITTVPLTITNYLLLLLLLLLLFIFITTTTTTTIIIGATLRQVYFCAESTTSATPTTATAANTSTTDATAAAAAAAATITAAASTTSPHALHK